MSRLPLFALLALPMIADAADIYRVGVAQVDITPSHPIRLNGFGFRRTESEGVYHRIWARAIAIEDESKEPALLITLDVLGIPDDHRAELAQRFAKKTGLKPDRLAITATHTHTGPMLKGANTTLFGVPIPKEHLANIDKYTVEFLDKVEQAGLDALKNMKPAKLSYAIGKVGFAANRRTRGGPVDHDLPVLFVHDPETGKVRAIYTSYACHCVTLSNNKIGGDWAGFAAEAIASAFPDSIALVSVGCGADSNPASGVTGDKIEAAQLQGREIAAEVKRLAANFRAPVTGKLTTQWKSIELPLATLPTRAEWEEKAKRTDAIGHHARVQLEKLDRKETLPTKIDYPIQSWSFGDTLAMVNLPGEVVVDFSLRLKKELDCQRLWVNGYTNGAPCYIPSERILKEGGYEGGDAMIYYDIPVRFKAGLEEPIIATIKDQLGKTFPRKLDPSKTSGTMPLSPQQSLAAIRIKPELVVELVAAEPLLNSPVAIDFGPDGKLWVCEMIDYPEGKAGKFEPGGRIRFLESTKGDGKFDKATTFLDGIPFPTGVTVWRKGVLICAAPDILYAEDTDGDGKADVVKTLFSGFGKDNYQGRVNSLQYGLDGWVYGACGLYGGNIKSFNGKTYALGNRDFRIKPDTGELEPVTGNTQQGRVRDDWGNWFGCDNSTLIRHYPLDDQYLKRNPHVTYPNTSVFVPADPNPNLLHPIRSDAQRFQLSGPPNTVTAACGLCIYRDDLLGKGYRGNAFVCEPVNLCVHRLILTPKGSTFEGHRAPDEKESEFLSSTDGWFRPVQAVTGPDGCLWIVDMYRHVIEHPRWIPPQDAAKLDLRAGHGMGRIYRVRAKEKEAFWPTPDFKTEFGLVASLNSTSGWIRDMAAQSMIWQPKYLSDDDSLRSRLAAALAKDYRRESSVQMLNVLHARGMIPGLLSAIDSKHSEVRRWAIRFAGPHAASDPRLGKAIAERANDTNAQVRLQVAYSLGEWNNPTAAEALGQMAVKYADDPYLIAAVLSSITKKNLADIVKAVFDEAKDAGPPAKLAATLSSLTKAMDNEEASLALYRKATEPRDGRFLPWQIAIVADRFSPDGLAELNVLIRTGDMRRIKPVVAAARQIVGNLKAKDEDRAMALRLLGIFEEDRKTDLAIFRDLLGPATSPILRSATVKYLGKYSGTEGFGLLFDGWKSYPPDTRGQVLDVILAKFDGPAAVFTAIDEKRILPAEIDASRRQRLLTHADKAIRDRAAKVFDGAANPDRAKVLKEYADVSAKGDKDKGKAVFTKVCAACHKLGDVGVQVGPDLAALANRTPQYLMQEILDPNRNLDSRYIEYQAITKSNRTVTGLLAAETATSIILRGQQGKEETLLRSDLEDLRGSGKSLMPEGVEKDISKKDMADLLAFLTAVRPPPKVFAGNTPAVIKPVDGRLVLMASTAEIYGDGVEFEQEFKNVGMWHSVNDRAEWRIELPRGNTFDIFFDFACDASSAGNELVIEGADPIVKWKVPSTGTWSNYQTARVAIVNMAAGEGRIVVRSAGTLRNALIDLRTVYLLPPGQQPNQPAPKDPTRATEVAKLILDDKQPAETRKRLIENNKHQSADLIAEMTRNISDDKEEYRRIPWIWRVAIAAGKRNDTEELRKLLQKSLPDRLNSLRDWQAVVIGGGIINGVSQTGAWPARRLAEIIGEDRDLSRGWQAALKHAAVMADNDKVSTGTRYDALRMVALGDWGLSGPILPKYLEKTADAELQMGAVSGLGDIESPKAAELLVKALPDLTAGNRSLAIAAMMRTPERALTMLDAVKPEWVNANQRKALITHKDERVRNRATALFMPK
jgi:putative membrane-bound dehydrogenase-like protein